MVEEEVKQETDIKQAWDSVSGASVVCLYQCALELFLMASAPLPRIISKWVSVEHFAVGISCNVLILHASCFKINLQKVESGLIKMR
jgi:hypothetical protein